MLLRFLIWLDARLARTWVFRQLYRLIYPPPTRFDAHFRMFDFPVRVHPAFWIPHVAFAILVASIDFSRGDPWWPLVFPLCFACTAGSVLAHELGHALAARRFGSCAEIVLTGLGGFAHLTYYGDILNMGDRPSRRQRVLTTLAGPAVNLVVGAVALAAWVLMGSVGEVVNNPSGFPQSLAGLPLLELLVLGLACFNLDLALTNLLPLPPLDGGRLALETIGWVRPSWDVCNPAWWSRVR